MMPRTLRCAVYTRKSTEHGLELEFNSLDAQREACEAYIKSQVGFGWKLIPQSYSDPAYSGGSLDRPALQQLLKDVENGRVDVIVVYKIDRLTRSLADFAKLVEVFDAKSVSFVAVTQQFNTTTSMGRLTLNVLLSFAQFERELSSERVRDKVAASRRKGKWTGGNVPYGYRVENKKLVVDFNDAKEVRLIFNRYLKLRNLLDLLAALNRNKNKSCKTGEIVNKRFTYGALAYLLKNRIYIGEIGHKGSWHAGEHEPIVDRTIFNSVQDLIQANSIERRNKRSNNGALLTGRLFDDRGNRMSPSYTTKRGVRYRFYVNSALLTGKKTQAGAVHRVSATNLEKLVSENLHKRFSKDVSDVSDQSLVREYVKAIILRHKKIEVIFLEMHGNENKFEIPWESNQQSRNKCEARTLQSSVFDRRFLNAVVRGHDWLNLLSAGKFGSVEDLASAYKLPPRRVRNELRLAFLAPDITAAIFGGSRPTISNLAKLQNQLPHLWERQRLLVGIT
jgi:DNA invertase Pin-like site-specific DNA recombinase